MSSNGAHPLARPRRPRLSRRLRLLLGAGAAVVIAAVLVAPVVISGGSHGSCAQTLTYLGRTYAARAVAGARVVEATAIGVGVARGCGVPSSNVNVRSLAGIGAGVALGVTADQSSIYVRRDVCTTATPRGLLTCLRARSR